MRVARGTLTEPGKNSPFRNRGIEENLDQLRRMRAGEPLNGARAARQDRHGERQHQSARSRAVPHPERHASAHRTQWKIYPSYDYAHGQSDAIEHITHSICTLEFEDHRPSTTGSSRTPVPSRPHQYEFARLNITYTVLSKRVLTELVRGGMCRAG
jgi:glutaminyl-tRNA synthetase